MVERLLLGVVDVSVSLNDSMGRNDLTRLSDGRLTDGAAFSGMYRDTLGPLPVTLREGFRLLGGIGTDCTSPLRFIRTLGLCNTIALLSPTQY